MQILPPLQTKKKSSKTTMQDFEFVGNTLPPEQPKESHGNNGKEEESIDDALVLDALEQEAIS